MKQIYATGPLTLDAKINDITATPAPIRRLHLPTIRGTSGGVGAHELETALPASAYFAPPARQSDSPLPVRLALLSTSNGRVLTHVTPNGGSFFAHSLLNVPETADAQLAIQTWGSPLWQRHDPHATADLPELPYLPVADLLDDAALKDWLSTESHRELLEFTLSALLGTSAQSRVFLAAAADDVARAVYAVTRALPSGLLDHFTFSTYESDPLASTARLIGFDSGSPDLDLPASTYTTAGVAFNTFTGKRTDLTAEVPFARFATTALADGDFTQLDEIKASWQRLGLKDARHLDLVYRLSRGTGGLTKTEAAEALQYPPLAAWVAANPTVLAQILEWGLDDRAFAHGSLSRAVQTLRQKSDMLTKLAQTVREEGLAALKNGDSNRTANAFEVILPMVAPTKANAVWGELLAGIADPNVLPWDMRWYLLPRFVRFKLQQNPATIVEPIFTRWLDVPAERLGELLNLDLPKHYQIAASRVVLQRNGEPSPTLAQTLVKYPPLTLTLLQPTDAPNSHNRAVKLFDTLLTETPARPWFEEIIQRDADYPPELLNRFFESSLNAGQVEADRLIRTQGARVIELFAGRSGLDKLGKQFLAEPPSDLLNNQTVLDFLRDLRAQDGLSSELTTRIDAVQTVRAYLDSPGFEPETITKVAEALALTPAALPTTARTDVFTAVAKAFVKRANTNALQDDLEATLVHFGPALAEDSTDLYENLLRDLRNRTDFTRHPKLVETFLAVALGATKTPELAWKLDGLDGHAFAVASDASKQGGNKLLNLIDSKSREWPKESRTKWGFLLTAVRPTGMKRAVRDFACVLLGGVVATIAGWLVKALT